MPRPVGEAKSSQLRKHPRAASMVLLISSMLCATDIKPLQTLTVPDKHLRPASYGRNLKAFHVTGHHILIARHGLGVVKKIPNMPPTWFTTSGIPAFLPLPADLLPDVLSAHPAFRNARLRDFIQTGETSSHRNRVPESVPA